jgi:hypothetical protein
MYLTLPEHSYDKTLFHYVYPNGPALHTPKDGSKSTTNYQIMIKDGTGALRTRKVFVYGNTKVLLDKISAMVNKLTRPSCLYIGYSHP